jgi:hypothetical protein
MKANVAEQFIGLNSVSILAADHCGSELCSANDPPHRPFIPVFSDIPQHFPAPEPSLDSRSFIWMHSKPVYAFLAETLAYQSVLSAHFSFPSPSSPSSPSSKKFGGLKQAAQDRWSFHTELKP